VLSLATIHNRPKARTIRMAARTSNQVPVPRVLWFAKTITQLGWHEGGPGCVKKFKEK
jgi:hypothetical protein